MKTDAASLDFVTNDENVARLLFSPLFISDGVLSQKAFTLDVTTNEAYISVLRPAISTFSTDIEGVRKEGNTLYGYALLNVGDIRNSKFQDYQSISLDVLPRSSGKRKPHAGIFASVAEKRIKGGMPQSVARLLIRMRLVQLAQGCIVKF